jgi:hypothetical protein
VSWPRLSEEPKGVLQNVLTYAEHSSDITSSAHLFCVFLLLSCAHVCVSYGCFQHAWWSVPPLALIPTLVNGMTARQCLGSAAGSKMKWKVSGEIVLQRWGWAPPVGTQLPL